MTMKKNILMKKTKGQQVIQRITVCLNPNKRHYNSRPTQVPHAHDYQSAGFKSTWTQISTGPLKQISTWVQVQNRQASNFIMLSKLPMSMVAALLIPKSNKGDWKAKIF